ncbi:hypothetical protein AAVH_08625 [Aphelenchoides avenae]|nr:hypothetical protein AAVH_08625 [Aphelenchus avenae]
MDGPVIVRSDAQYQALKLSAEAGISRCDRVIKEKQDELEEYKKLREAQTCDNSDSRIKELEEAIENLKREKELALRRLAVANELIAESEQEVSIREPYDETQKPSRAAMRRQREKQKVSDEEYKSLMSRLDQLEATEAENDEYNKEEVATTSTASLARSVAPEVPSTAANDHVDDDAVKKQASKKPLPGFKRGWLKSAPKHKVPEPSDSIKEPAQKNPTMSETTPPKGVSQEDYQRLLEIVEALEASSSSEDELEAVEELDEECPQPEENIPKPILRNKDYVSPVDSAALEVMENRDVAKIIPASEEAIKPDIVERVPWQVDPSLTASAFLASEHLESSESSVATPRATTPPSQPQKVSRFKAERMQARR